MRKKWTFFRAIFLLSFPIGAIHAHEPLQKEHLIEKASDYRDYYRKVTKTEIRDIRFILKTLAQKSLLSLWGYQKELEEAGDRIDHLHPLRFLHCIFSEDEFIVYINNIKNRGGWVWDEFAEGFEHSFEKELKRDNLKEEFFADFTTSLNLAHFPVMEKVDDQDWEGLIKHLIINVKRQGDEGKYDQ